MSNLNRHPVRRAAAGFVAGSLALTGVTLAAGISPASALPTFTFERLAGDDRYATAADIAREAFPGGATTAVLARGDVFADALAGNYLAGALGAPVLLTASNSLPAATMAVLEELGVQNIVIVGGTSAVSSSVAAMLAEDYEVERLGGTDRYLTAELVAMAAAEVNQGVVGELGEMRTAILGSGQNFPDVLAAGPLSYAGNHPLLITRPTDLPDSTEDVLTDLEIEQVVIVGGTAAVSLEVEAEIEALTGAPVIRLAGDTRYETAVEIAEAAYESFGFDESQIILARGDDFADALAGGPLGGEMMAPIVLTDPNTLSPATEAFLEEHSDTLEMGYILGGTAAVSNEVEEAAEEAAQGTTGPIALTATTVAQGGELTGTITGDFSSITVSGCGFTDEAIGADDDTATAGRQFTLTVAGAQAVGNCTLTFTATPTGGGAAVTQTIQVSVTAATTMETLNVTPDEAVTLQLVSGETTTTTSAADNRSYVATGLDDATRYRITLVNAASIQGTGASRTFLSSAIEGSTGFAVDTGADIADIVRVNGATPTNAGAALDAEARTATANPVNGSITFEIDGTSQGTVVPLVYVDGGQGGTPTTGGTSNRLETSATAAGQFAAVSETFGIGGPTTFVNPAAAPGPIAADTGIVTVDKAGDRFTTANFVFTFDANDVFQIAGVQVTQAAFEAALSSGDVVNGTVATDPSLPSTFNLTDANPETPTTTATAGTGANSNDVTVTVTVTGDADAVQIQRATVTNGVAGDFATIATEAATDDVAATAGVQVVFNDLDLAAGTFQYRAIVVNDGDTSEASAPTATVTTTAPTAPDTVAPTVADARVGTNNGSALLLEVGDTFLLALSEAVTAPSAGDTFRVTDADGTVIDVVANATATNVTANAGDVVINGATFGAGRVLTISRGAGDVVVSGGTGTDLGLPATVTVAAGTTDAAGNQLNLAGSADVVIDVEPGTVEAAEPTPTEPTPTEPTDTTGPTFSGAATGTAGGSTLTVNFVEALDCTTVGVSDFSLALTAGTGSPAGPIAPIDAVCADTDTVTLTFGGAAFESGQGGTVDAVDAEIVNDVTGNDQPDTDSTTFNIA